MSWENELAQEFKQRNNPTLVIGAVVGEVVEIEPLKISLFNGDIFVEEDDLLVCANVVKDFDDITIKYTDVATSNEENAQLTYKDILKIGDDVLVIASSDNQSFFIVDKLI